MSAASYRSRPSSAKTKVKRLDSKKAQISTPVILLLVAEKGMSWLAFSLLAASLGFYAWTVSLPKLWSHEYKKLETLQRHERQILAANESLKHQLAQQAEKPETGLTNPHPAQSVFIRSVVQPKSSTTGSSQAVPQSPLVSEPLGY